MWATSIGEGGALVEIVCNGCLNVRWHSFSGVGVVVGESNVTSSTDNGVLSNGLLASSSYSCERPIDWSDGTVVSTSESSDWSTVRWRLLLRF
jgi:hypothetical protein